MKSFWKSLSIFLLGGVLGTAFGIAVGFFIFPVSCFRRRPRRKA